MRAVAIEDGAIDLDDDGDVELLGFAPRVVPDPIVTLLRDGGRDLVIVMGSDGTLACVTVGASGPRGCGA